VPAELICPACGLDAPQRIVDSRPTEDMRQVVRVRECRRCGARYHTDETIGQIVRAPTCSWAVQALRRIM
jgi:transcriptional regulator NrdR family protein